jgi:hypothetical protein
LFSAIVGQLRSDYLMSCGITCDNEPGATALAVMPELLVNTARIISLVKIA